MAKLINQNLIRLCECLSDGAWHDGNTLGIKLSLSRSGIWKGIKKLQHYQVPLLVKRGKGYQLTEPLHLLNPESLAEQLHALGEVEVFESIGSTNDYLKKMTSSRRPRICFAEEQVAGKGRLGRRWYSPFGKNIYFSCGYSFSKDMSELAGLSLVVSLAILAGLKRFGIHEGLTTKWPNDILFNGKKLSGTLIEIQAESHGVTHAIIGVGMNVNLHPQEVANQIDQPFTSLREIMGRMIDRNALAVVLAKSLFDYLKLFETSGFALLRQEWLNASQYLGKTIELRNANEIIRGKVVEVNEQGHLVIDQEGVRKTCSSGDTSVIK